MKESERKGSLQLQRDRDGNGRKILGFMCSAETGSVNMITQQEGKAKIYVPVNENWNVGAETSIRIKTNQTARLILGTVLFFMLSSIVLLWRIRALEIKNDILQNEITKIQLLLPEIIQRSQRHESKPLDGGEYDNMGDDIISRDAGDDAGNLRIRRQIELQRENETELENEVWPTISSYNRERGKIDRRLKDQIAIAKLKTKLKIARIRANQSVLLSRQTSLLCDAKAAYLIVNGPDIQIQERGQHIGPWYIANNGSEYGFHDMWYQGLKLGSNGTTVIFPEKGLHLIYAQVYYTLFGEKRASEPLGFRIFMKKHLSNTKTNIRPYQIAECVHSFPSTTFQTCFTQVAWYVEAGDEIYLQHFTSALPIVEAEKVGQTFLGIVKLSG